VRPSTASKPDSSIFQRTNLKRFGNDTQNLHLHNVRVPMLNKFTYDSTSGKIPDGNITNDIRFKKMQHLCDTNDTLDYIHSGIFRITSKQKIFSCKSMYIEYISFFVIFVESKHDSKYQFNTQIDVSNPILPSTNRPISASTISSISTNISTNNTRPSSAIPFPKRKSLDNEEKTNISIEIHPFEHIRHPSEQKKIIVDVNIYNL
jgi:hypothetical protein